MSTLRRATYILGDEMALTSRQEKSALDTFAEHVRSFSAELAQRPGIASAKPTNSGGAASDPDVLQEALDELRAQHEELSVAEEELRAQMDEPARATESAAVERQRFRDLFAKAPVSHLVTDSNGVIQEVNAAALQLLGTDDCFIRGKPLAVFAEPSDVRVLRDAIGTACSDGPVWMRLRSRRGITFDCQLACSATDRGKRLIWTLTEIANSRASRPPSATTDAPDDEAARDDAARIESVVAERTRELARMVRDRDEILARERSTRRQLESADRAKDRFIAVLSHDLRAPINCMLGWTHLLRRQVFTAQCTRETALSAIERAAHAQLTLVEELLDISRIAADKLQLELISLDLGVSITRSVEAMVPVAEDRGLTLTVNAAAAEFGAFADRRRIEQITTNLLSNALKFTGPGGRVDVELARDGGHSVLSVTDTGRGISPETLPHVFEYFRQDTRDPATAGGLGLGLYIVRQLVELHGGTVAVISEGEGKGTRFEVRLPRREVTPEAAICTHMLPEAGDLEGIRVLLVEDEDDTRELLSNVLRERGATVSAAADAQTAIAMFDACRPDVVVSDIGLPGQDGCALVRKLRIRAANLPAVAISGFAAQRDADRAMEAGFDLHVSKPMDGSQLVEAIHQATQRHSNR